jgi:hypothetical protein
MERPIFNQQYPQIADTPSDPLSTFIGTMMESAVDEASFGIFKPDIVPQNQEELDKYSAMVGHMAGSIAGFIPSIALSGGAVTVTGRVLSGMNFGRKLIKGAEVASKASRAAGFLGGGVFKTGSAFAVHDVVREYINQVEKDDPDLANLGKAAATGFLTGGIFGFTGTVTKGTHPVNQMVWGGFSMATANAIGLAEDGEDITKENMIQSFILGAGLAAIGSRHWKQDRAANDQAIKNESLKFMDESSNPNSDLRKVLDKYTGGLSKQMPAEIEKTIAPFLDRKPPEYVYGKGKKAKDLNKPEKIPSNIKTEYEKKQYLASKTKPKTVSDTFRNEGIELSEQEVKILETPPPETINAQNIDWGSVGAEVTEKTVPGKKTKITASKEAYSWDVAGFETSPTGISKGAAKNLHAIFAEDIDWHQKPPSKQTPKERVDFAREAKDYNEVSLGGIMNVDTSRVPTSGLGGLTGWATPVHRLVTTANMGDILEPITTQKQWMDLHIGKIRDFMGVLKTEFNQSWNVTTKQKVTGIFKDQPTDAMEQFYSIMTMSNKKEYLRSMAGLTEKQQGVVKDARLIFDYFYNRHNEYLVQTGKPPLTKREGYVRRLIEWDKAKEMGFTFEEPELKQRKATKMAGGVNDPTAMQVVTPEAPVSHDVFKAMNNALMFDMKTIYLNDPVRLLKATVDYKVKMGELSPEAGRFIAEYTNEFILGIPSANTTKMNGALAGFIKKMDFPGGVEWMDKHFKTNFGERPVDAIARTFSKSTTLGMMGGRISLAIRDCFQSFFPAGGYFSYKNLAKAMSTPTEKMGATYNKLIKESSVYNTMKRSVIDEGIERGAKKSVLLQTYSSDFNVDNTFKGSYFGVTEKIKKNLGGWADKAGMDLRKMSGNNDVYSETELFRIKKEMEFTAMTTQFLYHVTGQSGVAMNPVGRIATKFQSFLMNYTTSYLPDMWNRLWTGHPSWDVTQTLKIPLSERVGIFKHVAAMGLMVAAAERAGFDLTSIAPLSYKTVGNEDKPWYGKFKSGIIDFRPSPGVALWQGLSNLMSGSDTKRALAKRELATLIPAMTVPGFLSGREVAGAIKEGEPTRLFVKKPYVKETSFTPLQFPKRRRRSTRTSPFGENIFQ